MLKLTSRQEEILAYVKEYMQETGYPPTRSEIASKMGFKSPNAAEEHLRALARKGESRSFPGHPEASNSLLTSSLVSLS